MRGRAEKAAEVKRKEKEKEKEQEKNEQQENGEGKENKENESEGANGDGSKSSEADTGGQTEGTNGFADASYEIIHGDCLDELTQLPPNSVNLIVTDPPWGINIEDMARFETANVHFDDSEIGLEKMIPQICPIFYKILVEHAHLYLFCAVDFFPTWKDNLEEAGFAVRPQPLIWVKEGGGFTDTKTKFMPTYEMIIFATKGSRLLNHVQSDVLQYKRPSQEERQGGVTTQKPILLLRRLIELSSEKGEMVLDPFAGSGSTIQAAIVSGREGLGIEKEEEIAKLAKYHCDVIALGF